MNVGKVRSPIPDYLHSKADKEFFADQNAKYLPYRGSSQNPSHQYLKVLYDLAELAPSQGTCISNLKKNSFKSISGFVQDYIPGLSTEEVNTVDESLKITIAQKLIEIGLSPIRLLAVSKCIAEHIKVCGNAWVHYQMNRVDNVLQVTLDVIHPQKVLILVDDNLFNTVHVCNNFAEQKDDNTKVLKVWPAFDASGDKKECIFHFKNEHPSNPNYGTPDSIQTIYSQFIEYALTYLSSAVSGKSEVSSKVMAFPLPEGAGEGGDSNPITMLQGIARNITRLMTIDGNSPQTIAAIAKPPNESIDVFDLAINRDSTWYELQMKEHSGIIYSAHSDHKQLQGRIDAKTGLGGNIITSLLIKYNEDAVLPMQNNVGDWLMQITDMAFEDSGNTQYIGTKIKFHNSIYSILNQIKEFNSNSVTNAVTQ